MKDFSERVVCCYLYPITKYGYPPKAQNTLSYIDEMSALGFKSIELEGIRKEHLQGVYDIRFDIKKKLEDKNLEVPYFCIALPGLGSVNKEEREENLRLFKMGCEIASTIGAKGVLDNAPLPPYQFPNDIPVVRHYHEDVLMSARFPDNLNWDNYWNDLIDTYRKACDIAAHKELTYLMHPCMGVLSATTDAFLYFADAVKRDNLRFNLDTANQFVMKDNLSLSLIRLVDRIDYIHISDNGGKKVEHLAIGDGIIHWDSFFESIKKVGFKGHFGIDIGGDESLVDNLDKAYINAANFIESKL